MRLVKLAGTRRLAPAGHAGAKGRWRLGCAGLLCAWLVSANANLGCGRPRIKESQPVIVRPSSSFAGRFSD